LDRLTALPIPHDGGLALIGDAHGHDLAHFCFLNSFPGNVALCAEDFFRIVLDPAGLRKDLAELALRARHGTPLLVEQDRARAGRALV
jgi:hypothetical protein